MKAYYRDLETCETLLGPDPDDKTVHRATLSRCFDHLRSRREAYGISEAQWKEQMDTAAENEDKARQAITMMIEVASGSEAWRLNLREFQSNLEKSISRSGMTLPQKMDQVIIPSDEHQLAPAKIAGLWEAFRCRFSLFRHRAEGIAHDLYASGKDRVLALKILHNVCHNVNEAKVLLEELGRKSDGVSRRQWIQSWKFLDYREDQVLSQLQILDPISDSGLIVSAIDDYYGDDSRRRQAARLRYKERLMQLGTPKARQLLKAFFGQEPQPPTTKAKGAQRREPMVRS